MNREVIVDKENWKFVDCNLCGSTGFKTIFKDKILCDGKEVIFNTVKCVKCGFIYNNPLNITGIGNSFKKIESITNQAQWRITHKINIYFHALEILSKMYDLKDKNLLDIGCACGSFLDMARLFGFKAKGIELSKQQAAYAVNQLQLDVIEAGTVDPLIKEHRNFFDVITMWDVLEHIPNAKSTLQKISCLLVPGGILMLKIPNSYFQITKAKLARLFFPNLYKVLGAGDHVIHFTEKSIKKMLLDTGFEVKIFENSKRDLAQYSPFSIFQKAYYKMALIVEKLTGMHIGNYYFIVAKKKS
ncbi:MAG: class I SAM-dependent methyltransferase [Candidatus Omnitrophica bacterium]|nr:class I SAM-dependent methyltransferase [Candidatus Omnitrophota bacterium]